MNLELRSISFPEKPHSRSAWQAAARWGLVGLGQALQNNEGSTIEELN